MDIKHIHLVLIIVSILLFLGFGAWTMTHDYKIWGYCSFIAAAGLFVYFVQFLKKMKAL